MNCGKTYDSMGSVALDTRAECKARMIRHQTSDHTMKTQRKEQGTGYKTCYCWESCACPSAPRKAACLGAILISTLIGLAASLAIEYCQFRFSLGNAEADDVICNTLGALIGALSCLFQKEYRRE